MRVTQRKGDIATARAIATFTEMGYDVSIPLTESAAYDLIVDDGSDLARVQCKFISDRRRQVDLRRTHSNSTGYVVKRTAEGSYEWRSSSTQGARNIWSGCALRDGVL